ncbi:MAG: hypothetical protein M3Y87_10320 [Myxococcota bacterium]|nr:hypothetical protein [Myxococcota bacterium]
MRTGSHLHARFAGRSEAEYSWFGISASSWLAVDPDRAARRIVRAIVRREAHVVIGWPAKLAVGAHQLWPGMTLRLLSLANRVLPRAPEDELGRHDAHEGVELADKGATASVRAVERMTRAQADHYHQR